MGDPKRFQKKYSTPNHPWNKTAIDEEKVLVLEYGLRNKRELYLAQSFLKKYRRIAKSLIVDESEQANKEKEQVIGKLRKLGLLSENSQLDDVLSLEDKDLLERRLQTVLFRKGLARSAKQARQFIVHRHVMVGDKEISAPSYLVSTKEEAMISFKDKSTLSSLDHPERVDPNQAIKEEAAALKAKKEKKAEEMLSKEETLPKEIESELEAATEEAPGTVITEESKEAKQEVKEKVAADDNKSEEGKANE